MPSSDSLVSQVLAGLQGTLRSYVIWSKGTGEDANPAPTTHAPGFPEQIPPESATCPEYSDVQIQ